MGWKYRCEISIAIFLLIVMPCCADMDSDTFLKFINEFKIVGGIDEIIYDPSKYTPNYTVQSSQHIRGWIDIIGFEGVVMINNISYLNNSISPKPMIKYEVWDEGITSTEYITNNNVDYIKVTDERVTTDNNITSVEIKIHLKWHHSTIKTRTVNGKPKQYIHKDYKHEYATFSTSKPTPVPYPKIIVPTPRVKIFNTTVSPKTIIHLSPVDYLLGYRVEFNNESVEYFFNIISVKKQYNGLPFGDIIPVTSQSIYEDSDVFSRAGNNIIINSTEINNNLRIFTIDPYHEKEINYTISNYTEPKFENSQLSGAFGLLMFGWVIVFLIKHYRK